MSMIKVILTISLFIIALSGQNDNMCFKYLEDIEIFNQIKEQPFYKEYEQYYIGLKQVQKQAQQCCKGLQLWIFQDKQFNERIKQQQRTLDENQLIFKLNDVPVYEQYYAFIHESQKLKFKVYNMKIEFIYQDNQQRLLGTYTNIQSELIICETKACTTSSDNYFALNDRFYLQQMITDSSFTDYYLTNTTIYYVGDGLMKKGSIEAINYSIKGKVTMLVVATIAWSKLAIQVSSSLSSTINGTSLSFTTFSAINIIFGPYYWSNQLKLCPDFECTIDMDINNIHLNDEIFAQYIVRNDDWKKYYLTNITLYFIGNGFHIIKTPLVIDNSEKGKITAFFKIDIVWNEIQIRIKSDLSTSETVSQDSFYLTIQGTSPTISCILVNNDSQSCPTCEEECSINKFNEEGCEPCVDNNMKIIRNMIMILLISFY